MDYKGCLILGHRKNKFLVIEKYIYIQFHIALGYFYMFNKLYYKPLTGRNVINWINTLRVVLLREENVFFSYINSVHFLKNFIFIRKFLYFAGLGFIGC